MMKWSENIHDWTGIYPCESMRATNDRVKWRHIVSKSLAHAQGTPTAPLGPTAQRYRIGNQVIYMCVYVCMCACMCVYK